MMWGRLIAQRRRHGLVRLGARACERYLEGYANYDHDLHYNGEARVLGRLGTDQVCHVFDVGAHVGDWTALALAAFPNATIHGFEVLPETATRYANRFRHEARVKANTCGLSDAPGTVALNVYGRHDQLTSLIEYPHGVPASTSAGEVTTGDLCSERHAIQRLHLLKIDVEGWEKHVLYGCHDLLSSARVDLVQFEYGTTVKELTGFLLRDFYAFFAERGYSVGKIYPTYVDFSPLRPGDERWAGPNYLAILNELSGTVLALG